MESPKSQKIHQEAKRATYTVRCSNCGYRNPPIHNFCGPCGNALFQPGSNVPSKPVEGKTDNFSTQLVGPVKKSVGSEGAKMTTQIPTPTNDVTREFKPGSWHWAIMILAGLYALLGGVDILPDIIPIIGELDDAGALLLFLRMAARVFKTNFGINA